jgi:hypothetical protein
VGVGYAIYWVHRVGDEPRAYISRVVRDETRAEEMVRKLNALSTSEEAPGYSWCEVWIESGRPEGPYLTARDRKMLLLARAHEALETERPVSVFFSFPFDREAAIAAAEELRRLGWPRAGTDEEVTGDDLWHVYGLNRRMRLNGEAIAQLRMDMEAIADRLDGEYDGWDVTGGHGLASVIGKLAP